MARRGRDFRHDVLYLGAINCGAVFFVPILKSFGWTRARLSVAFSIGVGHWRCGWTAHWMARGSSQSILVDQWTKRRLARDVAPLASQSCIDCHFGCICIVDAWCSDKQT